MRVDLRVSEANWMTGPFDEFSLSDMMNGGSNPYTEVVVPHVPLAQNRGQEQDKAVARAREKRSGGGYHWEGVKNHGKFDCRTDVQEEVSGVAQGLVLPVT